MKIAAGCIALLIAVFLLAGASVDFFADANSASERTDQAFRDLERRDDNALERGYDEAHSRTSSEEIRGVAGAAFLTAGLFIFGTRKKAVPA